MVSNFNSMEGAQAWVSRGGRLVGSLSFPSSREGLFAVSMRGGESDPPPAAPGLKQNSDPTNVVRKTKGKESYVVSPWGVNNLFPNALISIVYDNNLLPGLAEFKEDMIFGRGLRFVDGSGRDVRDSRLRDWLGSWDVDGYIESQIGDYVVLYNTFTQFVKTRDGKRISRLAHVSGEACRCTVMKGGRVERILVADWLFKENDFTAYPVFDPAQPVEKQAPVTMYHAFRRSPGYRYYGMPRFVGALHYWVPLLNRIPEYHLCMIRNSLNALFHVEIPYEPLERMRQSKGWSQEQLTRWIEEKIDALEEMLSGSGNAGKTFYSFASKDPNSSTLFTWKITPIDNKAKQLSEGYLKLFNDGNQALTSAMQVQPSLACIQLGEKMSSGSEVLNAYNLHMQTRTQMPRRIVLSALNLALKINFPELDVRACFDNVLLVHQDKEKSGVGKGVQE